MYFVTHNRNLHFLFTEIKKQNAEKISEMSDIVAKSKHDFADEIERERATSRQLKDALNNLQVIIQLRRQITSTFYCESILFHSH